MLYRWNEVQTERDLPPPFSSPAFFPPSPFPPPANFFENGGVAPGLGSTPLFFFFSFAFSPCGITPIFADTTGREGGNDSPLPPLSSSPLPLFFFSLQISPPSEAQNRARLLSKRGWEAVRRAFLPFFLFFFFFFFFFSFPFVPSLPSSFVENLMFGNRSHSRVWPARIGLFFPSFFFPPSLFFFFPFPFLLGTSPWRAAKCSRWGDGPQHEFPLPLLFFFPFHGLLSLPPPCNWSLEYCSHEQIKLFL